MTRFGTVPTLLALAAAGCRAPQAEPRPAPMPAVEGRASADVRFVRQMIPHHAQALAMTNLAASRATRDDVRLIAERIARSQNDEIAAMQRWLRARRESIPGADPRAHPVVAGQEHMPGMLTHDEMMQLEAASGPAFDRMFLEKMIRHHEGALAMVRELFGGPGAAENAQLYQIAADMDADQRAEISRMQTLLRALP